MSERAVVPEEFDESNIPEQEAKVWGKEGMMAPEPVFFKQLDYNFFRVEHRMETDRQGVQNLVVHFFLPTTVDPDKAHGLRNWWLVDFPKALDVTARTYFEADAPRLVAKYTKEVASWWFKARGYGHLLDPDEFLHAFFVQLDDTLLAQAGPPPVSTGATVQG